MRIGQTEKLSWFWERKLRVEHDLFVNRNKFYAIGWWKGKWRSKYRTYDGYVPQSMPILPWRMRKK